MASFAEQYGIRIYSNEFKTMRWYEFKSLVAGLGPKTALGRIVSIRLEDDKDMLKNFSEDQKRIRNQWRARNAEKKKAEDTEKFLQAVQNAFIGMAGGVKD